MAPHGLCPGAQILTIGPLSGSSAPYHCTGPAQAVCAKTCTQAALLQFLQPSVCRPSSMHAAATLAQCVP